VKTSDIEVPLALANRKRESAAKLEGVRSAANAFDLADRYPSVVVYATGSVGRGEAGKHSDLDIFCVDVAPDAKHQIGNLDSIQLFSDLIKVNEAGDFPRFSRDGAFLDVHHITDVLRFLGSQSDDYRNLFTARMLLLLESQPLFGHEAYEAAVDDVIGLYWRDCADPPSFKPTFLINDLVRYWKTLCLSHESVRPPPDEGTEQDRRRLRVAVLKLQFNRIWMVFNGLTYLLFGFEGEGVARDHARRLVDLSPLDRVLEIASTDPDTRPHIQGLLDEYSWFLEVTDRPKDEVEQFFADQANHASGRDRGRKFGDHMAKLVDHVAKATPVQRYLLI
jgi:predicted nucleotidyltransferase